MKNIEFWTRQLNGEVDLTELNKPSYVEKQPDIVKDYNLTLLPDGKCRLTLTNSPRVKTEIPTKVRIIVDSDSFKLKQVSIV
jgi:hypothetical protein